MLSPRPSPWPRSAKLWQAHPWPPSDGARVSVEVVGRGVGASAQAVGATVTCSEIGTGVVLSVAGEALAFVPNAIGRALLHNERL